MSIVLENIAKRFGSQWVVDNVSLEVQDGELFVLLGSSGSGKSTVLRMIAGLTEPTGGRVLLHGRDVTSLTPQERGTGFVFQNYSIFRHMNVAENIEFGLKIRKVSRTERKRRRDELLEMVGLAGLGNRYAQQLSGGQQQRVALARALAYQPKVLLLDEPFGALDVKIRAQLRRSLREVQQRLGVTTIVVTHDQEEAFELGDRIGVLERGRLLEVGPGEQLYREPRSLFTATFLGSGTVIVGRADKGQARFGTLSLPIPADNPHDEGSRALLLFRPEQVAVSADPPADSTAIGMGNVVEQSFSGSVRRVRLRLPHLTGTRQIAPPLPFGEEGLLIDAALPPEAQLNGDAFWVGLRGWTILKRVEPRVLIYNSGKESVPLDVARQFAEGLQASVTVLSVAESPEAATPLRAAFDARQDEWALNRAQLHIRYGNPAEQLAAELAESIYEMVVITPPARVRSTPPRIARMPGLEARSRLRQLGATLVNVLQYADIPVLLIKGATKRVERMLICTAAGEPGKSNVMVGGRMARRLGASVTLFYASLVGHNVAAAETDALTRRHLDRAVSTLRALDIEARAQVRGAASAASGILAEAADHDLIVIGSYSPRSRSFFDHNEVMLEVVLRADRPVLVVPADKV